MVDVFRRAYWKTNAADSQAGPCPRCQALDGKPNGDGWAMKSVGGKLPGPPPLHPNCVCTVEWRLIEPTPRKR